MDFSALTKIDSSLTARIRNCGKGTEKHSEILGLKSPDYFIVFHAPTL
jgi:hypothetical protein